MVFSSFVSLIHFCSIDSRFWGWDQWSVCKNSSHCRLLMFL